MSSVGGLSPLIVVEDSDEDFEALSRILRNLGLESRVLRCVNGETCLEFLSQADRGTEEDKRMLPCLILLDLNLPGMDGGDVIRAIKTDPRSKVIPVTVLTTSLNPRDIAACYACGANAYVRKPLDYDDLMDTLRTVTDFWLRIAVPPTVIF